MKKASLRARSGGSKRVAKTVTRPLLKVGIPAKRERLLQGGILGGRAPRTGPDQYKKKASNFLNLVQRNLQGRPKGAPSISSDGSQKRRVGWGMGEPSGQGTTASRSAAPHPPAWVGRGWGQA